MNRYFLTSLIISLVLLGTGCAGNKKMIKDSSFPKDISCIEVANPTQDTPEGTVILFYQALEEGNLEKIRSYKKKSKDLSPKEAISEDYILIGKKIFGEFAGITSVKTSNQGTMAIVEVLSKTFESMVIDVDNYFETPSAINKIITIHLELIENVWKIKKEVGIKEWISCK